MTSFAARFGVLVGLALLATTPSSMAQPADCAGEDIPTRFGRLCLVSADRPALTEADYGIVRLHFRPPQNVNDVIPNNALDGSFLERLGQRVGGQRINSAAILLEVRAVGQGVPSVRGEDGSELGVPLAMVPLAVYGFENRNGARLSQMENFANRVIGPRLLLRGDQTIRARLKVSFSQENPASLISALTPIVETAAAFGGHGWVVSAVRNEELMGHMNRIEGALRSVNNVNADSESWIDLDYHGGANQLVYDFRLDPRRGRRNREATPHSFGRLTLSLERLPSLFTSDVLPGERPGRARPDYRTDGRIDPQATGRIWTDGLVAPNTTPERYIAQDAGLRTMLELFQNPETPVATFDSVCRSVREAVGQFNISMHDREAIFWAAFVRGGSAMRYEHQQSDCIARVRDLWASYNFALPRATEPPPPIPSPSERDEWLAGTAIPAFLHIDPEERARMLRPLFRNQVLVNFAPNTLFPPGEEPEPNAQVDRSILVSILKPINSAGCRFVRLDPDAPRALPRFSMLARLPDRRLAVITIDYGGRARGASRVEITGIGVSEPTDEDWDAIDAMQPALPARCRRANAEYAPSEPPAQ